MAGPYYIARNPDVSAARITLAHAAPYGRLVTALHDMGGGVIFDQTGAIVAFHERHADLLTRRGSARMYNA
jgi:hypothetical protein